MPGMKPTMGEFGRGALHSGSKAGPIVTNRKQAIAIALSEDEKEKHDSPAEDAKEHGQRKALRKMRKR